MAKPPPTPITSVSSPTTPVFFTRISDRDLTEIELHSVESINDLHRTHPEYNHKGSRRPPLPPAPSTNGNPHLRDRPVVCQTGHPMTSLWQRTFRDLLTPTSFRYTVIALMLLMLLLIFYFLVQQGSTLRSLTKAVRERQAAALEISQLIQELQALCHNLSAITGGL
uniref:uncharacterized protein si:dkey-20d21.12 n=1 Tax=Oncorhynchus gorbuscha TaxID=8017 RepID=UPI001EAE91E5|nr:uncharacterized protein si:dkey-20d21.12 [Oncorhynchus gorbuscha]XP_046199398.1 uncharacterized protein si:dkey-20d21.12 [Oncorhynchus gorbuscha]